MAVMLITHAMGVVAENAQRVAVMYAGRVVVEEAPVDELFGDPHHPYTQGLIRSIPRVDARGDRAHAAGADSQGPCRTCSNLPPGCRFSSRCQYVIDECRAIGARHCAPVGDPNHRAACIR